MIARLLVMTLSVGGSLAGAQPPVPPTVRSVGSGTTTWVLLNGVMGGVSGFRALEAHLLRDSDSIRVVSIDSYQLSLDSTDVTYEALARRVGVVLDGLGVERARVVGHANGAGVALRLAAFAPELVEALYFLDAGALKANGGRVLSGTIKFIPMIAKFSLGRWYIRRQLVGGMRENLGVSAWFDDSAQKRYVEPMLQEVKRVIAMAIRMGESRERDSLHVILARVQVPVTVILGDAPHPTASAPVEIDALKLLSARVEVIRLPGVGHFPHEEATAVVAQHLMRRPGEAPYQKFSPGPAAKNVSTLMGDTPKRFAATLQSVNRPSRVAVKYPIRIKRAATSWNGRNSRPPVQSTGAGIRRRRAFTPM